MGRRAKAKSQPPPPPPPPPRKTWPWALGLALLAFLVFSNCLRAGFVWDDEQFVQKNAYLASWSLLPKLLSRNTVAGAGLTSNLYRPLQSLTHFLDVRLYGAAAWGHHLTNLLFHAGASAAVFYWLLGFAPAPSAAAAAAMYALHPLQAEAVAYVSGRGDTMGILFLCLGLVLFRKGRRGWALVCAALAVASKESMALFPVFLLLDAWGRGEKIEWKAHAPFWALSGAYAAARLTVLNFADTMNFYGRSNVLTSHFDYRLATYFTTLPAGLRLWLWPSDLHHERSWVVHASLLTPVVAASAAAVAAWLGAAFVLRRRAPAVASAMAWFVVATIPTSNLFVVINALFYDHWFLLPGLGLAVLAARLLRTGTPALALCGLLILGESWGARAMDAVWHDPISLNSHILRYETRNAKIYNNLAMALADEGRLAEAEADYKSAIRLDDEYPQTHHNLARVYEQQNRLDAAAAEFQRALAMDPSFFHSRAALGVLELRRGRRAAAQSDFEQALKTYPYSVESYLGLAELLLQAGDRAGAEAQLEKGYAIVGDPRLRQALESLRRSPRRG